jgi:hypothetical protein
MKVKIANPIYDTVFKYLMEDDRIAKISRLEEILNLLVTKNTMRMNKQTITIDDSSYEDDSDMNYIIKKLLMASSNEKMRREMSVEEEIFSEIDSRDVKLKEKDETIEKQNQMLKSMAEALLKSGMSLSEIAKATKMDECELKKVLNIDNQ